MIRMLDVPKEKQTDQHVKVQLHAKRASIGG